MTSEQHEIEVTLLVRSATPRRAVQRLENLRRLGDFRLEAEAGQSLRDLYFDLPDPDQAMHRSAGGKQRFLLSNRGFGLRLRQRSPDDPDRRAGSSHRERKHPGVEWLLCLKQRGQSQGLAVRRLEIEGPPGDAALRRRIADATGLEGIATFQPGGDPAAALQAAGFVIIHDRCTRRRVRRVMGTSDASLASLVIDSVDFDIDGGHLWHHEVEIEAESEAGEAALHDLAAALQAAFPKELVPWRPSKLRTGLTLQDLVRRVGTSRLVNDEGDLLPPAYDLLLQQWQHRA